MSARIRLKRTGAKNAPCYRVVVIDSRCQRDGKVIEELGYYSPMMREEKINLERADYWLGVGAKPSETVHSVIERVRAGKELTAPKPGKSKKVLAKVEAERKAAEDAKAAAAAPAAPAEEAKA